MSNFKWMRWTSVMKCALYLNASLIDNLQLLSSLAGDRNRRNELPPDREKKKEENNVLNICSFQVKVCHLSASAFIVWNFYSLNTYKCRKLKYRDLPRLFMRQNISKKPQTFFCTVRIALILFIFFFLRMQFFQSRLRNSRSTYYIIMVDFMNVYRSWVN